MSIFRFLVILAVAFLSMLINVSLIYAWEFRLSGETTYAYEYYNQQGRSGFFGPYDVDRGTNSFLYNRNFWYGIPRIVDQNVASGSDAAMSYLYVSFFPEIAVNNAIKLKAEYHIGGWNDSLGEMFSTKDKTPYLTDTAFGTEFAMATGHWTMYWADVQTPWGKVIFGKRPRGFGMGLQYDGARSATSESISFTTNYGPFTIGIGFYPYRLAIPARTLANQQIQSTFNPQSSYNSFPGSFYNYQWINSQLNKADKSATNKNDFEGYVRYSSGPLDIGIFAGYFDYHVGSEWSQDFYISNYYNQNPPYNNYTNTYQTVIENASQICHGSIYGKYNNGKFFLNCEAAWLYTSDRTLLGNIVNGPNVFASPLLDQVSYVEQWRYAIEAGTVVGPAKFSFLYAFSPGLDRRAGVMFDKQPSAILRQPTLVRQLAGVSLWRQYAYILPYTYNSGLPNIASPNFFRNYERLDSPNKEGQMLDALVLAGRLDWSLASNLNLFGTYLWAERASKGYSWGSISPNTGSFYGSYNNQQFWTPFKVGGVGMYPAGQVAGQYQPETSPNVLDTPLGYEVDLGLDWKLLENFELSFLVGRWQPGSWFSYACIDRSVSGWNQYPLTSSNSFGTRPSKTIDPIWATRVAVNINF